MKKVASLMRTGVLVNDVDPNGGTLAARKASEQAATIARELRNNPEIRDTFFGGRMPRFNSNSRYIEIGNCRIEAFSAGSELEDLGLVVNEVVQANSATVPFDRLIGTNPQLGEQVKAGSSVSLTMSTGKVTVPPLVDLTRQEAEEALADEAVQLKLAVREVENTVVEPGTITDQEPRADQSIDQGGTVTVTIAVAPAPAEDADTAPVPPAPEAPEAPESDSAEPSGSEAPGNSGDAPGQTREPPTRGQP